jgi:hypothetical protein
MFIGSIAGLAMSPALIAALGWPSVFYIFGSLGVVWYSVWSSKAASTPSDDALISNAEKVSRVRGCGLGFVLVQWVVTGFCGTACGGARQQARHQIMRRSATLKRWAGFRAVGLGFV